MKLLVWYRKSALPQRYLLELKLSGHDSETRLD
jgi:hypothetical protein